MYFLLTPIMPLPDGFMAGISTNMGQLFTDFGSYIALIVGCLLGTLILGSIIEYVRHR